MLIRFNGHHRFTKQFDDVPQHDIAACPLIESGESPDSILARADVPDSIKLVVRDMPYGAFKNTWLYVRPQRCVIGQPDARSGSFFHVDVDSVYRCVAPSWDPKDWRVMIVSFGDVAETEFIAEPIDIELTRAPRITDYVEMSAVLSSKRWQTESPLPGQVTEYSILDVHRAGPIRRSAWRLAIVCFETNVPPLDKWPPVTP